MGEEAHAQRYRAFISYSHKDARHASWLQRALEAYRLPKHLVGRQTARGVVPPRLGQVFRDRNDLPVAPDLRTQLTQELTHSANLIVVCSPAAVKSEWVNQEILSYKRLHGNARVFALIVEGEPFASLNGFDELECLPAALRLQANPDGSLSDRPAEPLACDLRHAADGKRMALLKLIAGMLGLGLDELVRRDHQRRLGLQRLITAAALIAVGALSTLSYLAFSARDLAEQRRLAAEDLINFMLTDLRARLEPIGRLDVLDVVGEKALAFYSAQAADSLPDESLSRQATAMHLLGEMRDLAGDTQTAVQLFTQAAATTREILDRKPGDQQAIFDHAQSVFWVGYPYYQQGDYQAATSWFERYLSLARQLVAIAPDNPNWQLELFYALGNMAIVKYQLGDYQAAMQLFQEIGPLIEPGSNLDIDTREERINHYSWLGTLAASQGRFEQAIGHRHTVLTEISSWLTQEPDRQNLQDYAVTAHHELARLYDYLQQLEQRDHHLALGLRLAHQMVTNDPDNTDYLYRYLNLQLLSILLADASTPGFGADARQWTERAQQLAAKTPDNLTNQSLLHSGTLKIARKLQAHGLANSLQDDLAVYRRWQSTVAVESNSLKALRITAALANADLGNRDDLLTAWQALEQSSNFYDYQAACESLELLNMLGLNSDSIRQQLTAIKFHKRCA